MVWKIEIVYFQDLMKLFDIFFIQGGNRPPKTDKIEVFSAFGGAIIPPK